MTLIEEIQNEAVDSKSDLSALLRKCKLLAARLGSKQLENWLIWESNGYPDEISVPDYRSWPIEVKGHFSGPFGSGLRNAPIPWGCLPEKVRESYERYACQLSIASIEETLRKVEGGTVQVCTGDLAMALGTEVYQNQNCMQAWAEFSIGNLIELLNAVRNRILDFALAIWKEEPAAGEGTAKSKSSIEEAKLTQIFNTTVYGGAASLVGSAQHSPVNITVNQGDFSSLDTSLRSKGVLDADVKALHEAIQQDHHPAKGQGFGPCVSSWIANMMKKAADGSWAIGLEVAGSLLAQAISKYYGL